MADSTIVFLVLAGVVLLFVSNLVAVEIVAVGTALTLWATGVLEINEALAGFGDPTVVYIASLFVVSEALDATGVTAWAGQQLVTRSGSSERRLLVSMMLLGAVLTALISVNGAVAALLPVVVVTAVRLRQSPSRLLMPLAFAAHAGSMLALTGSPVNVIVSEAAKDAGSDYFGFFEFTLVGIPLLVGTVAIIVLFGRRMLPNRRPRYISKDFSDHARTLLAHYELDESSLRVTARGLAVMGATLADGGVNPITGARVIDVDSCRCTLAVMPTAGLYETSGDWLYRIGLPGKSGIGGSIVTVAPGKGGLGTFAPRLDAAGNIVRGQLAAEFLSRRLGLDIFLSQPAT